MTADTLTTIILFDGFNEVTLPKNAHLHHVKVEDYQMNLLFQTNGEVETESRQFYVAFNNEPTGYNQGILHLLKTVAFADGTSLAMVYEVYPYESSEEES